VEIIIEFSLQFSRFSSLTEFSFVFNLVSPAFLRRGHVFNREAFVLSARLLIRRRGRQLLLPRRPILLLLPHPPATTVLRRAAAAAAAVAACTVGGTGTEAAAPRL